MFNKNLFLQLIVCVLLLFCLTGCKFLDIILSPTRTLHIKPTATPAPTATPQPLLPDTQNPGDMWLEPGFAVIKVGDKFMTSVYVNTGSQLLAAYGLTFNYDRFMLELDASRISAGEQGFISAQNTTTPGMITVSGFDTVGKGPSPRLELLKMSWKAISKGNSFIMISVSALSSEKYEKIGYPRGLPNSFKIE